MKAPHPRQLPSHYWKSAATHLFSVGLSLLWGYAVSFYPPTQPTVWLFLLIPSLRMAMAKRGRLDPFWILGPPFSAPFSFILWKTRTHKIWILEGTLERTSFPVPLFMDQRIKAEHVLRDSASRCQGEGRCGPWMQVPYFPILCASQAANPGEAVRRSSDGVSQVQSHELLQCCRIDFMCKDKE